MILAGDVAIGHGDRFVFEGFPLAVFDVPWCVNLEGAITSSPDVPAWGVYNSSSWMDSFLGFNLSAICIANNHIHDVPDGIRSTVAYARDRELAVFGAGESASAAGQTVVVNSPQREYVLLGFGWPVIGCREAAEHRAGVNRLETAAVVRQVTDALGIAGGRRLVVVIHGNYEFERYPQPALRQLAMTLIDKGVYAVIGHHPHIVGPVERYKGRTIAYSVGNWAFSSAHFFQGRLVFPNASHYQIAVELDEDGDTVHHACFAPPSTVTYRSSERVSSKTLSLRAGFEGLSHSDYVRWFKINRVKKKGLPVYVDFHDSLGNGLRNCWVFTRQVLIDLAAKIGLKAIRRSV